MIAIKTFTNELKVLKDYAHTQVEWWKVLSLTKTDDLPNSSTL